MPTGGGGWWAVGGTVAWAANATGVRQMYARVNGSAIFAFDQRNNNTAGDAVVQTIASRYQVAAGDYFELFVFQNSGAALAISATANYSPEFWAEWVAV